MLTLNAELESQPPKAYLDSLKKIKDELNELESKVHSIMNSVNDLTQVEKALEQTKVCFFLALGT